MPRNLDHRVEVVTPVEDVALQSELSATFEALWRDYRLSVLSQITTPVWQAAHGIGPWIWWYNYERVMAAVEDLDCLEFLG